VNQVTSSEPFWGLLGPEQLVSTRRVRTLGLGASIRRFNDLAVPGMGGVFFAKQICLAVLGVAVAQRLRETGRAVRNIETANAIEALACWFAYDKNGWNPDRRLKGIFKLRFRNDVPTFAQARRASFYVTQPMRMATVQPLLALGLVSGRSERFNGYGLDARGRGNDLIDSLCEEYGKLYYNQNLLERLTFWALGDAGAFSNMADPLSPIAPLRKSVRDLLWGFLVGGESPSAGRRRDALAWTAKCVESEQAPSLGRRPAQISPEHWKDIEAGALLFATREAAVQLLLEVEGLMRERDPHRLPLGADLPRPLVRPMKILSDQAKRFLDYGYDPSASETATAFCRECLRPDQALPLLVKRDDRVLRLGEEAIIPGPAFVASGGMRASEDEEGDDSSKALGILDIGDLSHRIRNLMMLQVDLRGNLSEFLRKSG